MTTHSDLSQPGAPLNNRKAQRQKIHLGTVPVQVFLLPEGDYCLSQTEVADVIGKGEVSIRHFLNSKGFKALLGSGFESVIFVESVAVEGSNKPISPLSFHVAGLYWYHWAQKDNESARALCQALMRYSLQELANDAFGKKPSLQEKRLYLEEQMNQPTLPPAAPATALPGEMWAAAQQLMQLSQENARLRAEVCSYREAAAHRRETHLTNLLKSGFLSESGQRCYPINSIAHLIAEILHLPSDRDGVNWILGHPEVTGNRNEWKAFRRSALIPELPQEAVHKLIKLAQAEAPDYPVNRD